MNDNVGIQAVASDQTEVDGSRPLARLAIFNANGTPIELGQDGVKGDTGPSGTVALVTVAGLIGTAEKTTSSNEPDAGSIVPVKFTSGNSAASVTVSFDGGTARVIQLGGVAPSGAELAVAAGGVAFFYFDGTILHQVGVIS